MDKERFSLLLLEPSEIYFEDFYVQICDITRKKNDDNIPCLVGHLKMCSKSLVFDSKDKYKPLIKIPYKDCTSIYEYEGTAFSAAEDMNVLCVNAKQHIEMLSDNILEPYKFCLEPRIFYFKFFYAKVSDNLPQICQLHRASSLHAYEQNSMIATIVYSRHKRIKFNPLWLDDIYEKVVTENYVEEINPLVVNPGRLLLSSSALYFQPYNNINPYPVLKIKLKSIYNLTKRRFLLRHIGLEIKWKLDDKDRLLYISFRNQTERDEFCKYLLEQDDVNLFMPEPEAMTLKWQNGIISNYDYLLYLNSLADRCFQDLTQYPVFPWVISNYTGDELDLNDTDNYRDLTKPIGALNAERLERLKERCEEMSDPKFLYGSHYSAPGLVLFYLVRKFPNLMLCLQNGRFDHPDRMFNLVQDAYHNCLNNMSDFKELIPEFYDPSNAGDFLVNVNKIDFGIRCDGTPVNDVILPPWANKSTETFIKKLRDALESDYVSRNLNYWIDLIFGYKQRGNEALKANNLFYYLCYEGSVDLESVNDLSSRHALEVQISEFGQIPKQLFTTPHVPKIMSIPSIVQRRSIKYQNSVPDFRKICETDGDGADIGDIIIKHIEPYVDFLAHKDLISSIILDDNNNIISAGKDGIIKCYSIEDKLQTRSVSISTMPISSCIKIPQTNVIAAGSWDNTIITYNFDYGKVSNITQAHDDAVSCLSYIEPIGLLISGSWDCSIKIWKGFDKESCQGASLRTVDSIVAYLSLEEKITSLDSYSNKNLIQVLIGTKSGDVLLWELGIPDTTNLNLLEPVDEPKPMGKHDDEITAVAFGSHGCKIVSCGFDKLIQVIDVDTGMILFKKYFSVALTSMNWSRIDELLLIGDASGHIHVWDVITGTVEFQKKLHNDYISCISISRDNKKIITAGKDDYEYFIKVWNV